MLRRGTPEAHRSSLWGWVVLPHARGRTRSGHHPQVPFGVESRGTGATSRSPKVVSGWQQHAFDPTRRAPAKDAGGRLVRAFEQHTAPVTRPAHRVPGPPARSSPGLVEALRGRELELLWLLAVGEPNREIVEELRLALDRVKKHATHILDKLGAATAPRQPAAPASSACSVRAAEPPAQPPVSYLP